MSTHELAEPFALTIEEVRAVEKLRGKPGPEAVVINALYRACKALGTVRGEWTLADAERIVDNMDSVVRAGSRPNASRVALIQSALSECFPNGKVQP